MIIPPICKHGGTATTCKACRIDASLEETDLHRTLKTLKILLHATIKTAEERDYVDVRLRLLSLSHLFQAAAIACERVSAAITRDIHRAARDYKG